MSASPTPALAGERVAGRAFTALMTAAMAVSVTHTFIVGPLAPFWTAEMGISAAQIGVVSAVIVLVAGVGSLWAGRRVDRHGGRQQLYVLFATGAVGLLVMGAAPGYWWLLLGAAIGGASQAVANPATNLLIAQQVPRQRQPVTIGIKQSGVQIPALVVGLGFPAVAVAVGWRPAVIVSGLLCLVGIPACRRLVRPAADDGSAGRESRPLTAAERRFVRWMTSYTFFMGLGVNAFIAYVPLYAVGLGATVVQGGSIVATVGLLAVVGRLLWARAGAGQAAAQIRSLRTLAVIAIASPLLLVVAPQLGLWSLWASGAVHGLSASSWNALGMLLVVGYADERVVGRATGVIQGGYLAGLTVSPLLMAATLAISGSYQAGWIFFGVAFVLAVAIAHGLARATDRHGLTS